MTDSKSKDPGKDPRQDPEKDPGKDLDKIEDPSQEDDETKLLDKEEEATLIAPSPPVERTAIEKTAVDRSGSTTGTTGRTGRTSSDWGDPEIWKTDEEKASAPGDIIKDRFELLEKLGEGGMGVVFKALDRRKREASDRNPYVAIKILNKEFRKHPESLKALQREARKAQELAHPNIMTVYDFDREGSMVYMTMQMLTGEGELKDVIKKHPEGMEPERALRIIEGMSNALAYAHEHGIVHSDFKPGNVWLEANDDVKVFDFGIARATKDSQGAEGEKTLFDAGSLGALTPAYASLQMLSRQEPTIQDDIYAVAIISYELFTGHHPFRKERADRAQDKKLIPERIKGINSRQWKGLLHGLAFSREDRTPTIEQFRKEITQKKSKLPLILTAAGIVLLIAASLSYKPITQNILVNQYIASIQTGDDKAIDDLISNIGNLTEARQKTITDKMNTELIAYFGRQAKIAFDPANQRFNYVEASRIWERGRNFYPDSNMLEKLITQSEEQKANILVELDRRFEKYLGEGKILPNKDEEDVHDVLGRVSLIDPEHSLLTDERLEITFVTEAQKALGADDLKKAETFVTEGLFMFETNTELVNLNDKLQNISNKEKMKSAIASLESDLEKQTADIDKLEDFSVLSNIIKELRELQPDNSLLKLKEKQIQKRADLQLADIIELRKWEEGEKLLLSVAEIMNKSDLEERRGRFEKARNDFDNRVNTLLADLTEAISKNRLKVPKKVSAAYFLAELEKIIPDDIRVQRAHTQIAKAYLKLVEKAKSDYKWDEAQKYIASAMQQKLSENMQKSLGEAKEAITQAENLHVQEIRAKKEKITLAEREKLNRERDRQEKEKRARIQTVYDDFERALASMKVEEKSAGDVLSILDRLTILNPDDSLLTSGREKVAGRFLLQGEKLEKAEEIEQAIKVMQNGLNVIPESKPLSTLLASLKLDYQKKEEGEKQSKISKHQKNIKGLLAKPTFTEKWVSELQANIRVITPLVPDDAWLKGENRKITAMILKETEQKLDNKRFEEARALLGKARRFDSDNPNIGKVLRSIDGAEKKFNELTLKRKTLAEVAGRKQTLLTQAKANGVVQAKKIFERLRAELPENDPFIRKEAPTAIGEAYLRLAEKQADKNDLSGAIALLKTGLEFNSKDRKLATTLLKYNKAVAKGKEEAARKDLAKQEEAAKKELAKQKEDVLSAAKSNNTEQAEELLKTLRAGLPANDVFIRREAPAAIGEAYLRLAEKQADKDDLSGAIALLKTGLEFNSKDRKLATALLNYEKAAEKGKEEAGKKELTKQKEVLLAKVRSKDLSEARAIFDRGKDKWPRNDREEARVAIVTGYLNSARANADKKDFKNAMGILNEGLEFSPGEQSLKNAILEYRRIVASGKSKVCKDNFAGYGKRAKARCYDMTSVDERGPAMVVVPARGSKKPFAIGRYEVSIKEYNAYCKGTGNGKSITAKDPKLPATGISVEEAKNYSAWLTKITGFEYRLPTDEEWVYSAESVGNTKVTDANCRLVDRTGNIIKGQSLVNTRSGGQNGWGMKNYIGNAQEWVTSSSGIATRGGAYKDTMSKCKVTLVRQHSGKPDEITGFRLVRQLESQRRISQR